jgi:cell division protein FtsB
VKALLICLFIGGAAVGYVCQKDQLNELGRQKKQQEMELEQLRRDNAARARRLSELHSPAALEQEVRRLRLDLALPSPGQIVTLPPEPAPSPTPHRRQFAQH